MTSKLDTSAPYSTVRGDAKARFFQDGNLFDRTGEFLRSVPGSVEVAKSVTPPAPTKSRLKAALMINKKKDSAARKIRKENAAAASAEQQAE